MNTLPNPRQVFQGDSAVGSFRLNPSHLAVSGNPGTSPDSQVSG